MASRDLAGEDAFGLGGGELGPGRPGPPGCRVDTSSVEDGPDGAGADAVTQTGEFALDSSAAPGRVLPREAQHQLTDLRPG